MSSGFVFDEKEGPKQSSELHTFDRNSTEIEQSDSKKVKNARPGKLWQNPETGKVGNLLFSKIGNTSKAAIQERVDLTGQRDTQGWAKWVKGSEKPRGY